MKPMMQQIFATAHKDFLLVTRDSSAFATLLLMPLVFILVMSLALADLFSEEGDSPITLLVANEDKGAMGASLVDSLENSGFTLIRTWQDAPLDQATSEQLIISRRFDVALIIPENFSDNVREGIFSGGEPSELFLLRDPALSEQILTPLRGAIRGLSQQAVGQNIITEGIDAAAEQLRGFGAFIPNAASEQLKNLSQQAQQEDGGIGNLSSIVTLTETLATNTPQRMRTPNAVEQNVPGYTLFGVFFIVEVLAGNIMLEKQLGTFRRLLAAPLARAALLAGKLLAFLLINLMQITLMFAVGIFVLPLLGAPRLGLGEHPFGIVLISIAVSLAATGLGLLVATIAKTREQVSGIGLMIVIPLAILGGVMAPRYIMPDFMQQLGLLSPHTWALEGYHDVILRGATVTAILPTVGVLLTFAAVFFSLAAWRFRW